MNQANTDGQKITFNSRELQNEFDLFVVAMDFRQYDPALGRFTAMDLLAEKYHFMSPYQFGNNNPVYWADPSGLEGMPGWLQDIWDASPNGYNTTWTNTGNGSFEVTRIWGSGRPIDDIFSSARNLSIIGPASVGTTYDFLNYVLTTSKGSFQNIGDSTGWELIDKVRYLNEVIVVRKNGKLIVPMHQIVADILSKMPNSGGDVGRGSNFPSFWSALSFGLGFGEIARNAVSFVQYGASAGAYDFALNNGKYYHRGKLYWQGNYPKVTQAMKNSLSGGKFLNSLGKRLTVTSGLVTVIDGSVNGWKKHHTADLVVTGGLYLLAAATPVGWVVGGLYTLADLGVQAYTGKSITQNIFD